MSDWGLLGVPAPAYAFVTLALVMIVFEVFLLVVFFPGGRPPRVSRAFLVTFLFASSIFFWVALPPATLDPTLTTWTYAIQAMMIPMTAPFLWMMTLLYRANERSIRPGGWLWPAMLTGSLVTNEVLMAWAFVTLAAAGTAGGVAVTFAESVNSVWFAAAMLASMAAVLVRLPFSSDERLALGGLATSVLAAPWISTTPLVAGAIMSATMGVTFGLVLWRLTRSRRVPGRTLRVMIGVAAGFAVMSTGALASIAVPGLGGFPFALASLLVMSAEMLLVLRIGTRPIPAESIPAAAFPTKSSAGAYLR